MPTYEYSCAKCGKEMEIFHKISDPPRKRCPACRGTLRRKIGTGAGIIFKGSGFYTTDYRSESYRKAASAEKKDVGKASEPPTPPSHGKAGANKKSDAA